MKKLIYAVKRGRETGIFKEWAKCHEQIDRYSNAKFLKFEYRSELEDEPEDVPGSLRHAIKEAEEFLGDLAYLGESADYLEDVSWKENGFLRFGDESEAENLKFFLDQIEEDEKNNKEDVDKWIAASREKSTGPKEYWAIAEDMKNCVNTIRKSKQDAVKKEAAFNLKVHLTKCLSDENLSDLTAIYKNMAEDNAIGYNPPAVREFVRLMINRYPKPAVIETEDVGEEAAEEVTGEDFMQKLLTQAVAMEYELKDKVFGQDVAIEKLRAAYYEREMTFLLEQNKRGPRNVYLLAGPPGVGKTYTAYLFAKILGLDFRPFDMEVYSGENAERELQGYARQYKDTAAGGVLTEYVDEHPRCVLLFDEIEKADSGVMRLFLQILEEGVCTDRFHNKNVSFEDTIIFFTTNAGKQLYSDAQNENLTLLPDKVVIDALRKDINPKTKEPYFPPEILSRMSSYTVLMMNHLKADTILKLVEKDIEKKLIKMEKKLLCDLKQGKEELARTILYSMGGSADARNASKIAGKHILKEMYDLWIVVEKKYGPNGRRMVKRIEWKCDYNTEEIRDFYLGERDCVIPVFGAVKYKESGRIKDNKVSVKNTVDIKEFMEIIRKENVLFAVVDYIHGLENVENVLNVVDAGTIGRSVFLELREKAKEVPVYILVGSRGHEYTDEEKNALIKKGAAGFIEIPYFKKHLELAYKNVCCQVVMENLAARHQVLTYETKKEFDKDTNVGSIIFCDFKLETAVEAEDKSSMLSDDLRPNKSWDDILLPKHLEYFKEELKFYIDYLARYKKYNKSGERPRGVLLYGPPGTGKTSLAKVVASESKVNFLSISASELFNGGPEKIQEEFRIARKYAPAILFIDEIDAIGMKREYSNVPNPTLNALLTEMDGFNNVDSKPVFVMAATNLGNKIDFALQRRFDMSFVMDVLDKDGNEKLLKKLIDKHRDVLEISGDKIGNIADRSLGYSPAKLEQVVKAAVREAIRSDQIINDDMFDKIFERCILGEERVGSSQKEIERTAYHEVGHALIDLYNGRPPVYLSIVARGNHGGYTQLGKRGRDSTKKFYLEKICSILGGRAAEIVLAKEKKVGAEEGLTHGPTRDLEIATYYAAQMVCRWGMYEEEIGLAASGRAGFNNNGELELECDEKEKELINRILSEQLKEAIRIIEANKDALERLVKAVMGSKQKCLTEKEILKVAGKLNRK